MDGAVYVAGSNGKVFKFDPDTLVGSLVFTTPLGQTITAMSVVSETSIWVIQGWYSTYTRVAHWDGNTVTEWSVDAGTGTNERGLDILAFADDDVYVLGGTNTSGGELAHWDGNSWSRVTADYTLNSDGASFQYGHFLGGSRGSGGQPPTKDVVEIGYRGYAPSHSPATAKYVVGQGVSTCYWDDSSQGLKGIARLRDGSCYAVSWSNSYAPPGYQNDALVYHCPTGDIVGNQANEYDTWNIVYREPGKGGYNETLYRMWLDPVSDLLVMLASDNNVLAYIRTWNGSAGVDAGSVPADLSHYDYHRGWGGYHNGTTDSSLLYTCGQDGKLHKFDVDAGTWSRSAVSVGEDLYVLEAYGDPYPLLPSLENQDPAPDETSVSPFTDISFDLLYAEDEVFKVNGVTVWSSDTSQNGWTVTQSGDTYTLTHPGKFTLGSKVTVSVTTPSAGGYSWSWDFYIGAGAAQSSGYIPVELGENRTFDFPLQFTLDGNAQLTSEDKGINDSIRLVSFLRPYGIPLYPLGIGVQYYVFDPNDYVLQGELQVHIADGLGEAIDNIKVEDFFAFEEDENSLRVTVPYINTRTMKNGMSVIAIPKQEVD
jgi:hypothetical protein